MGLNSNERQRAVVIGVPGVGKSTVLENLMAVLAEGNLDAQHVNFGTVMMELAKEFNVKNRDDLRKLNLELQKMLQIKAAQEIASKNTGLLIIDTHVFVRTRDGLWPGLPTDVLRSLAPTNLVLIQADPKIILDRRQKDKSRHRDIVHLREVSQDLELARSMLAAISALTDSPLLIVENAEGKAKDAALAIAYSFGVDLS